MLKAITLLLLITSSSALSQSMEITVNPKYRKAPYSVSRSPIKLAKYLTAQDSSEFQQALNIYTWIAHNIRYDVKALRKVKAKAYTPKQTLKRRKGICYQYSNLFETLCLNAGLSSREVTGYSRGFTYQEDDRFYEADHSWNSIKLDSSWYLVDVTWGSGKLYQKKRWFKELKFRWFNKPYINDRYAFISQPNYNFFLADPASIILDHLPADPYWQLLEFPISINTFESSAWKSYLPKMDSMYEEQIDSAEYVARLNRYEYLSDLQYLYITAEQSHVFNPRNFKLLGLSSYSMAKSTEKISGTLSERLEAYNEATQLYKQTCRYLKKHQAVATSESKKMMKSVKSRISNALLKPVSVRIKKNNREINRVKYFISKKKSSIDHHKNQILKLQHLISKPARPFTMPEPSKLLKEELVDANELKIQHALNHSVSCKDSVSALVESLKEHLQQKKQIEMEMAWRYLELIPTLNKNIQSIAQNRTMSQVIRAMQPFVDSCQKVDSLNTARGKIGKQVSYEKRAIKQLHSSIISKLLEVRKLVVKNCQFSKNDNCQGTLYNAVAEDIKSVYKVKKHLETDFLSIAEHEEKFNNEMAGITAEVKEVLEMNYRFIRLFQNKRLGQTSFKLKKTFLETDQIIGDSQNRIRSLTSETAKIKNELIKKKDV